LSTFKVHDYLLKVNLSNNCLALSRTFIVDAGQRGKATILKIGGRN